MPTLAAEVGQDSALSLGLDSLGDNDEVERMGEVDDALDDGALALIAFELALKDWSILTKSRGKRLR